MQGSWRPGYVRSMTRIAIVGGNGQIARHLIPLLVGRGHTPVALVRNEDYFDGLRELGAEPRLLDIENAGPLEFAEPFDGCGSIVFAAGGGPDGDIERKRTVDLWGSLASIGAAKHLGIKRFVQISAIGIDRAPDPSRGEVWAAYVEAKRQADEALRETELDWTIVRPGRLTDDAPIGKVSLGQSIPRADIPRADVAAVLAQVHDDERTYRQQWNLVTGATPVAECVDTALARHT